MANSKDFGVTLVDLKNNETHQFGNQKSKFTLQSVSKPFTYLLLQQHYSLDFIRSKIGVEPSGEAFNSIVELEKKTSCPHNPMINSGAIAATALLFEKFGSEAINVLDHFFSELIGENISIDQKVFESEEKTAHRNRSIAYLLKHFNIISDIDIEFALNLYFRQCSYLVSTQELAAMGSVLSLHGKHPHSRKQLFSPEQIKNVLNLMFTCGMYDSSGEWAFEVGLPSKSGVSGGIICCLPGVMSLACYSPLIDRKGHSLRGMHFIKEVAKSYQLSLFAQRISL